MVREWERRKRVANIHINISGEEELFLRTGVMLQEQDLS